LGRAAYFAHSLGDQSFTLINIPFAAICQEFFVMNALGAGIVTLPGETPNNNTKIRILHPDQFFVSDETYDIAINLDSITKLRQTRALEYLRMFLTKLRI
jgi:hypothetical protein